MGLLGFGSLWALLAVALMLARQGAQVGLRGPDLRKALPKGAY
jgi:hypothetical protein